MTLLSRAQVEENLSHLPGWKRKGDFIMKSFKFKKFMDGVGFVDRVATVAEGIDHHPDIHVVWTTVTLQIQSHDEGGLTSRDFRLASEIEKRLGQNLKTKKK